MAITFFLFFYVIHKLGKALWIEETFLKEQLEPGVLVTGVGKLGGLSTLFAHPQEEKKAFDLVAVKGG